MSQLLPPVYLVLTDFFDANTKAQDGEVGTLLYSAGVKVISELLQDDNIQQRAVEIAGTARRLLDCLPFLRKSPDVTHKLLKTADFGINIHRIRVNLFLDNTIMVDYNFYQPLLLSNPLESSTEALNWAQKFLELAVQKEYQRIDIHFPGYSDDEWEEVQIAFIETANETIDNITMGTGYTYATSVNNLPRRCIYFTRMTLHQADQHYYVRRRR